MLLSRKNQLGEKQADVPKHLKNDEDDAQVIDVTQNRHERKLLKVSTVVDAQVDRKCHEFLDLCSRVYQMLSKKTQYAFHALTYLTENQEQGPILIAEISANRDISLKFLENILLELKKGGILGSKKGKGGGYYLLKDPQDISLAKIIRMLDGPIALLPCVSLNYYEKCESCDESNCGLHTVMCDVRDNTLSILETKTIADIIRT